VSNNRHLNVTVCPLILGKNDGYFLGIGGCNFQTIPKSRCIEIGIKFGFLPKISRGGRRVRTPAYYNGIKKCGNIPVTIVLETCIGGCLHVHHMGEKDQLEKF